MQPLTKNERLIGYTFWRLTGDWSAWVRRRVVTAKYETATSLRRQVSVDLRLHPSIFGKPVVRLGAADDDLFHYVPIARVKKQRLLAFDVWDEEGRVLPLVTRRRNSRLAAATLAAVAQTLMYTKLRQAGVAPSGLDDPTRVVVPPDIEEQFWRLAVLDCSEGGADDPEDAGSVYRGFVANPPAVHDPVHTWRWARKADGRFEAVDVDPASWIFKLAGDPAFAAVVASFERTFLVCVPLREEPDRRRVIKYNYTEPFSEAESKAAGGLRNLAAAVKLASAIDRFEEFVEGIPSRDGAPVQWIAGDSPEEPLPVRSKLLRGIGWRSKLMTVEAAGVADASSYHLEVELPSGLQVKRAHLRVISPTGDVAPTTPVLRGVRNVERVHMYASAAAGSKAEAALHIRPQSSVIVRGAVLCALLTAIVLTLVARYGGAISSGENDQTEAAAAILVLVPGILAAYAARGEEHPLATSMLFGLRLVALLPGVLSVVAAGLIVFDHTDTWAGPAVAVAAWLLTVILSVAWRLATRGRPHPSVVPR